MKSLWNERESIACKGKLGQRVYSSRLLGREPSLVLHGGGNTSVKIREKNLFEEEEDVLYVKRSGQDLADIDEAGFVPLRLAPLRRLLSLDFVSESDLAHQLKCFLVRSGSPPPSIETFLHALLPYPYVDHTHADALLAISNAEGGESRIRKIYGSRVVIVPYVKPGFKIAKAFMEIFEKESTESTEGIVLMHHGLFSFGDTAKKSYEKMIDLVAEAKNYLRAEGAWALPEPSGLEGSPSIQEFASLRKDISDEAGFPLILSRRKSSLGTSFARRIDVSEISLRGPVTPDHVLRTKRLPMVGRDVAGYSENYRREFLKFRPDGVEENEMLDPVPRIILDVDLGFCSAGRSVDEADIAAAIYGQTMEVILRAEALGGYRALPPREIFEIEYWELERLKLKDDAKVFSGEIALVTGTSSGIGRACVDSLHSRGAAVTGLDLTPPGDELSGRPDYLGVECDVTDDEALSLALEQIVHRFGGVDILILNAGIFPSSRNIADLSTKEWRRVMDVNLDANLALMRMCYPLLKLSPKGGRVVAVGSKNVPAPGRGAAAYSTSKAALTQLMRVAALEWAAEGVRINMIHPNAVFDTGVWNEEVLASRAKSYGLSIKDYKKRNLLNTEVSSRDVAEMAAEMCGPFFSKTIAAQVPVDGGNDRVI